MVWQGYEQVINHQAEMGQYFKNKLLKSGWLIKNYTGFAGCVFLQKQILKQIQISQKKYWIRF